MSTKSEHDIAAERLAEEIAGLEAELVEVEALKWPENVDSHVRLMEISRALITLRERQREQEQTRRIAARASA